MAHACAAEVLGGVGEQRQVTSPLDGISERALVFGTSAGLAPRFDAAPIGYEPAEEVDVLVVHNLDLVSTHDAYPAPAAHPAPRPLLIAGSPARPLAARPLEARSVRTACGGRSIIEDCGLGHRLRSFVFVRRISLTHIAPLFEGDVLGSDVATNRHGIAVFG